ncbi:hypothetical protein OG259_07750 [Streptomyces sp. NBC_00250]|uniref:hypothetical protein n=1 Tax=Streptomyces sp. NBC_00250 TaxID=2903641 RepID=UPI002E2A02A1|nr:hypothetical protein [Streptomyces sp. NBC_00250]
MSTITALAYRTKHRIDNRWWDFLAVLNGYCNDRPVKTGVPGQGGGYSHTRCALPRGHDSVHRSRNYVWGENGKTMYLPVEDFPSQPWGRHPTSTLRQARNARRWHAEQSARRKFVRLDRGEPY